MLGETLAGRYKLTEILGAGGFGQTYLATDTQQSTRPLCVVKQLKPASQDSNFLTVARRLFETEVKTLERLGSHSHIPQLLDSFEEDNEFYLVQEFIDGTSLEDEIKQTGQLSEAQVIALLEGVLPVLGFIHENHVVHRDLKPDNLIRRRSDGELVLIDFGAVKEIRTRIITGERTALTIGIGTQGYTPSEQLAGKPRYSSDLYALGMTAIHALTGRAPADLPEDLGSLDLQWQGYAEVSPGLAILLNKMTCHYIYQRYQQVDEVQTDLGRLDELVHDIANANTDIETLTPAEHLRAGGTSTILRWRMSKRAKIVTAAIATVLSSTVTLSCRQIGLYVTPELIVRDLLIGKQTDRGPDPRLLVVTITEQDLRSLGRTTPSDESIAIAINTLQQHQPASIGVDLLRDLPQEPGHAALQASLRPANVVSVTKLADLGEDNAIAPPPGVAPAQISFNNIVRDPDFRVRRAPMLDYLSPERLGQTPSNPAEANLIATAAAATPSPTTAASPEPIFSLGVELAIRYLSDYHSIQPANGNILQLGDARFPNMSPSFGSYRQAKTAPYQMLIRYRSPQNVAAQLSFTDVLNNNFDPALVTDKIVLIGASAVSSRDVFLTPYNRSGHHQEMPGVVIHAQVVSQILSAVLDQESLPWAWPDWVEVAWIIVLAGIGGTLIVLTQRAAILIAFAINGVALGCLVSIVGFHWGGWVPLVAPTSSFIMASSGVRISKSYQRRYWEARQ